MHFWSKVIVADGDGCWGWRGALQADGYGQMKNHYRQLRAHRVSWELHNGPIPDGMLVCHTCDNRPCTNPGHLFLGTYLDNNHDMIRKGRAVHPPRAPRKAVKD